MAQPIRLLHQVDPRQQITEAAEPWVKNIKIRPYDVMLAMYLRDKVVGEKITLSGIHLPDNGVGTLKEDLYQGKVGLVMKVGSLAFTDESDHRWQDFTPSVGDWVVINVGDTFSFDVPGGWRIRIVDENLVRAIIPAPDMVW